MTGQRPLLVSNDADLIDDVLRLAAANGVEIHLAADADGARSRWPVAPLVIVGADAGAAVAVARLPRRRDVVLLARVPTPDAWQSAVAFGAEHVVSLPEAERWLLDRLAECGEDPPRDGRVVSVMGSGAGAGASTFAATLALAASGRGLRVLLVDVDAFAGGLDVLLGIEDQPGVRWLDLAETRGRLGAQSLQQALPSCGALSVLSWGRDGSGAMSIEAVSAVLDAATRAFDLIVADVPRHLDAQVELVLARSDTTLLVTSNRVRATAAAARLTGLLEGRSTAVHVVLRMDPKGLGDDAVEAALGRPVIARLPLVPALPTRSDEGEPPVVSDAYGRACLTALRAVVPAAREAA